MQAMMVAREYLSTRKAARRVGSIELGDERILRTLDHLLRSPDAAALTLYRIKGEDGRGNVHFTGYFTPMISASPSESDVFRYPLYRLPAAWDGGRPTREQIDAGGALAGKGLELAWTDDLVGNYFMQVQGSGFVRFGDGSQLLLMYAGTNGYPYSSIGKYLVSMGQIPASEISLGAITRWLADHPDGVQDVLFRNKSYTFFTSAGDHPVGAGDMQLVAGHSIAADPAFLPFGAVALGKVPVLGADGRLIRHEYRLLVVQDRGGAIKGPGHVDLYEGVGDEAGLRAGPLHHYGALWLLLTR
jgi:membrane-bound lytic murein transglycosylase A